MAQIVWGNAWTSVGDHRLNRARCARAAVPLEPRAQGDTASGPYCLQSIDAEVKQHLLQLIWVAQERRYVVRKC